MKVIRNALIYNIEIEYGFEVPNKKFLKKAISGFKKNVNVLPYLLKYSEFTTSKNNIIDVIIYGLSLNVSNIHYYLNKRYDSEQLYEIFKGIENKVDVNFYNKIEFDSRQMEETRLGLEQNLNVEIIYAKPEFNSFQMEQIRLGLLKNLNVKIYSDPNIKAEDMERIRKELENKK